jgi:carboxymethylenebutenolidase
MAPQVQIEETLKGAGKDVEMHFCPNAQHGFMCDERDSYNEAAAKDAWEKMVGFFKKHLG